MFNDLDIPLYEYDKIRTVMKTMQFEMAENLIKEIQSLIPDISKDLNTMVLLDALGCAGLSLVIGEYASETFIARSMNTESK